MRYKITTVDNHNFFVYGKKQLFSFLYKNNVSLYNFNQYLVSDFCLTANNYNFKAKPVFYRKFLFVSYNDETIRKLVPYSKKGAMIIRDELGFILDYSVLYADYKNSLINSFSCFKRYYKVKNRPFKNRGTQKYRNKERGRKNLNRKKNTSLNLKFYADLHQCKLDYPTLNLKTDKFISNFNSRISDYYDCYYEQRPNKSWKNKKIKKQWMK